MADLATIFSWFETGDIPTQEQFRQTFSSFRHKEESVSITDVAGLNSALNNKLGTEHSTDVNAHHTVLAKLDASNLNYDNVEAWRTALGVGTIPDNVGLVDDGLSVEIFNKDQIRDMAMMVADFVENGKIRADKIEALGLTDLIEANEIIIDDFAANADNYEFQQNDFIAVPDVSGNYSLFMFKGGDKMVIENYLPTGLTNITIGMVEGLQMALDGKLNVPASQGDFYLSKTIVDGVPYYQYKVINLSAGQIPRSFGGYIGASQLFEDNGGKIGIGTSTPSEQLQIAGRGRMQALVLNDNSETLPQQLTYTAKKFFGTDDVGVKRPLMFADNADFLALANSLTDAQKTTWKTAMNGGWTTNTMSVGLISPPVVDKTINQNSWILLKGSNLNLNPVNFSLQIMDSTGTTVVATIPNSQVQLSTNGIDLIFYFNFSSISSGNYKIKLWNGVADYVTPLTLTLSSSVTSVDFTDNVWQQITPTGIVNDNSTSSTTAFSYRADFDVIAGALNQVDALAILSKVIAVDTQNFYLEINHSQSAWNNYAAGSLNFSGGIVLDENSVSLTHNLLAGFRNVVSGSTAQLSSSIPNSLNTSAIGYGGIMKTIIIKTNNIVTILTQAGTSTQIETLSLNGTGKNIRIKGIFKNTNNSSSQSTINIIQANIF